ncbi:hypothetical protein QTG54_008392 [Skeletonema marinoi]|uniref:Right handed beta helix domain-containing protein n=1 Tax=Skeletonema marinoi TaxID=267567 RepID=A0AAD8Y9V7_9STRA|nr:hypothetical protein QTG54_008392 [Skeletonema marinoi]
MNNSNYQVEIDHAKEGAFDVEQVNFDPPSSADREDGISISSFEEDKEDANAKKGDAPTFSSLRKKLGLGAILVFGVAGATIAGVSLHSANKYRYVQSQKSNSLSSDLSLSKSGKAAPVPPYCSKQTCGQTFTEGDKITFKEDLFCAEDWNSAPNEVKRSKNCAITLEGNAELDCNGYTIFQATTLGSDAAVKCDTSGNSRLQKAACELYYYRGICLTGGAKMKNCQVEKFLEGIYVENSGDIKDSTVSQNRVGIAVKDGPGNSTEISTTIVRDNAVGIDVDNSSTGNKISINQVRSNNNVGLKDSDGEFQKAFGSGMNLYGEEIAVKDSEASSNERNGIKIDGAGTTTVDLKGSIFLRNNGRSGLKTDNNNKVGDLDGTMNVDGVVNIYENGEDGFQMNEDTNLNVELKKGSSLIACQNGSRGKQVDIKNNGGGTFGNDGFTCDDTGGDGSLPTCSSCPACPM